MIVAHLAEAIKNNAAGIQDRLHIGYAIWDDLVARVERQEANPKEDFHDEQIWTFLVGCGYALPSAGAAQLAHTLVGEEQGTTCSKIWFEILPKSPRVKEGSTHVDLALGAIKLRSRRRETKQPPKDQRRKMGAISSVPHRPTSSIFPQPFDAARAGYSGQVPKLRPERLYLSLFRLIQKVLRRSP